MRHEAILVAATGSSDSHGGCFRNRDLGGLVGCTLVQGNGGGGLRLCMCESPEISFDKQVNSSPLTTRGWVFQEGLLSPRIVHFASRMIFWECQTCTITEQHPHSPKMTNNSLGEPQSEEWTNLSPSDTVRQVMVTIRSQSARENQKSGRGDSSDTMEDFKTAFAYLKRTSQYQDDHFQNHIFTSCWYELVTRYTLGRLTKREDRLVAISGIAAEIQSQGGMAYFAGL